MGIIFDLCWKKPRLICCIMTFEQINDVLTMTSLILTGRVILVLQWNTRTHIIILT